MKFELKLKMFIIIAFIINIFVCQACVHSAEEKTQVNLSILFDRLSDFTNQMYVLVWSESNMINCDNIKDGYLRIVCSLPYSRLFAALFASDHNKVVNSMYHINSKCRNHYYETSIVEGEKNLSNIRLVGILSISFIAYLLFIVILSMLYFFKIHGVKNDYKRRNDVMKHIYDMLYEKNIEIMQLKDCLEVKQKQLDDVIVNFNKINFDKDNLETDFKARAEEVGKLRMLLSEANSELFRTSSQLSNYVRNLNDAADREEKMKSIIVSLFRNRNALFFKVSEIFIQKRSIPSVRKSFVVDFENLLKNTCKDMSPERVEEEVNNYMDNILMDLRSKCPTLSDDDVLMTALIYAGYMPRLICDMCGYTYKYYYTKRGRIIKKIEQSVSENDRVRFIDMLRK